MSSIPRSPIALGGVTVEAFLCHCGGKLWPFKAYEDHLATRHGPATSEQRVCIACHHAKPLREFINKDHLLGATCRDCRKHSKKGRRRSSTAGRAGRPRQYSDVVLGIRGGFRTIYRPE